MEDLVFTPLNESGLSVIRSWFNDPELKHRIEYPTDIWFHFVSTEPNIYSWIIEEDDRPVGQLQLDVDDSQTGYIGIYVNPALRRQGYGKRILQSLFARPEVAPLNKIMAPAEIDNLASQACLKSVGFLQEESELEEDGFFSFVYAKLNLEF
ncbi:MAG: GNAT family N-acetyltransferase [Ardenticatenaceae bacterium]|nr:GNAT family N-acetyltransferase [Ardenticatenaceae bacterium]